MWLLGLKAQNLWLSCYCLNADLLLLDLLISWEHLLGFWVDISKWYIAWFSLPVPCLEFLVHVWGCLRSYLPQLIAVLVSSVSGTACAVGFISVLGGLFELLLPCVFGQLFAWKPKPLCLYLLPVELCIGLSNWWQLLGFRGEFILSLFATLLGSFLVSPESIVLPSILSPLEWRELSNFCFCLLIWKATVPLSLLIA